MLPILNDEDDISTFNQQTAHIGTSFVGDNSTSTHFDSNQYNIPLNLGGPRYVCCFCGAQMWYEERKNKSRNERNPRFTMCCMEGKVSLPPFKQTPSLLATLLNYKGGRTAYKFRHNIRVYNSMFQFTSIGGKIDSEINRRLGPYVFKINGQNHHKIGSLLPVDGERSKFAQLYIYDTENEVSNRINALGYDVQQSGVEENIVKELMEMLDQTNQIVKAFRMAKERFKEPDYIPVKLRLIGARMNDGQQYTNLISSEVAALIVGDVDQLIDKRDIIIEHRSNGLRRISDLHPAFMPMQYPLLFPYGEDGFHLNIPYQKWNHTTKTKRGTVTAREFYVYMLQFRLNQGFTLFLGGKLFHQYITDAFTSVEGMRLDYNLRNQKKFRTEIFQGVVDAFTRGDTDGNMIGKRIILPASFTGGPRYYMQNYQDAMAICTYYGYPDLFITFTCNSRWPEIIAALKFIDGQRVEDRPDISW
ncbi:PREDICTED: uncharacterized protein LOC18588470 [Theobroma cacao]|uniref:Uncharacterized protein LOC18588470 n=1 Tax=Theobroma cacao TaxID=3641 RepID=A0AB32X3X9_THECC|nr:PREDICTED: uncharacterized protein LOC18588470 [Theobroma cacao]